MELEVKHLAPYLPYSLKLQYIVREKVISTGIMQSISQNNSETHPTRVSINYQGEEHIWMYKPMLRRKTHLHTLQSEILIRWGGGLSDRAKAQWLKEVTEDMIYASFNSLRYDFVELMLENHIDVFGLIDAGLATEMS